MVANSSVLLGVALIIRERLEEVWVATITVFVVDIVFFPRVEYFSVILFVDTVNFPRVECPSFILFRIVFVFIDDNVFVGAISADDQIFCVDFNIRFKLLNDDGFDCDIFNELYIDEVIRWGYVADEETISENIAIKVIKMFDKIIKITLDTIYSVLLNSVL